MPKTGRGQNPYERRQPDFELGAQRAKDWLQDTVEGLSHDLGQRADWLSRRSHYQRRRYAQEMRNPELPWRGSSDIILPLIDKAIDQLKPRYANLVFAAKPPVTVLGWDDESHRKANRLELWFEWLLKFYSPNFGGELVLGIDDLLETGRCIYKTFWRRETRQSGQVLDLERLPQRLRQLQVAKTPRQAEQIFAQNGNNAVLTQREFDGNRELLEKAVARELGLGLDSDRDRKVVSEVLAWFRNGAEGELKIAPRDVVLDAPAMVAVSPIDFLVPAHTEEIEDAERMAHMTRVNRAQLQRLAWDSGWNREAVNALLENRLGSTSAIRTGFFEEYREDSRTREGIREERKDTFELWEVCSWFSDGPNQPMKRVVVLVSPDNPLVPLKSYVYTRKHWPYRTATFERNKRRWHSPRGVPEKLNDLEKEVTFQHRQKLNRMMMENAPSWIYGRNSGFNPGNVHWLPGQFYEVANIQNAVLPMPVPQVSPSEVQEEQILQTWADEYIGGQDFGNSNVLSNLQEPRTATEIRGIQNNASQALSLRGALFQEALRGVYDDFFELWHTYGPDEVVVKATLDADPIRLTKKEMQGNFRIQVIGTIGQQDPQFESAKRLSIIQVLLQVAQAGALGDRYEMDLGEAVLDWLEGEDVRLASRVLRQRTPEEVQQIREQRQRQEDLMRRALSNQELDRDEAGEVAALNMVKKNVPFGGAQRVRG